MMKLVVLMWAATAALALPPPPTTMAPDVPSLEDRAGTVTTPPMSLQGLNRQYYTQYINASGIAIVAAAKVSPQALIKMESIVSRMVSKDAATRQYLVKNLQRILIIPKADGMTTLPEYVNLDQIFPLGGGQTWNQRAQGVGWTLQIPYVSCSEANLLHSGYPYDRYTSESICIHEFGHAVWDAGVVYRDSGAAARLTTAYNSARAAGTYGSTYASTVASEYWAEGLQSWFNAQDCSAGSQGTTICNIYDLYNKDRNLWNEIGKWFYAPYEFSPAIWP